MRSASVGVNSRAPRRISTLFWSFMRSPFIIWARFDRAQISLYGCANWPALADGRISVFVGARRGGEGARGFSLQSTTDEIDFLLAQGAGASAKQYSVLVVHALSPFVDRGPIINGVKLALHDASVSIPGAGEGVPGDDVGVDSSVDEFNFLGAHFPRSRSGQYTVAVIHALSPFVDWGPLRAPKPCK